MKNKIGWCNLTFNPVWGCRNRGCPYCYARTFAKRFGGIRFIEEWKYRTEHNIDSVHFKIKHSLDLIEFKLTFLHSQFDKKFPQKTQKIFVGSMSEIYYWEDKWIEKVLEKVKLYPQHTFQFLTRYPDIYLRYDFPKNCWLGITIVEGIDNIEYQKFKISNPDNLKFICFEPLFKKISINLDGINWIILGAETGNRKGKVVPKRKWFEEIVYHRNMGRPSIYVKDNLTKYYPEYKGHKEFPGGK